YLLFGGPMIDSRDVRLHKPTTSDLEWAETNYFSFYVPEESLNGCIYVLTRANVATPCLRSSSFRDSGVINGKPSTTTLGCICRCRRAISTTIDCRTGCTCVRRTRRE